MVQCEFDLVGEEVLRIFPVMRDDARLDVSVPEHLVEEVDAVERRNADLARFENDVAGMKPLKQPSLSPVQAERYAPALWISDLVEVVHSPRWVC